MNFLEREKMLDGINAQIKKSNLKLRVLKGGKKDNSNDQVVNHVQSLIKYLKNSKNSKNEKEKQINFQIKKMKEIEKYLHTI